MPCKAVADRKGLTEAIRELTMGGGQEPADYGPDEYAADGSEDALLKAYEVLTGIVAEYTDGGDQMAEECTCPQFSGSWEAHVGVNRDREGKQPTFDEILRSRRGNN